MKNENSRGLENAAVQRYSGDLSRVIEKMFWDFNWTCEKWSEDACDYVRKQLGLHKNAPVRSSMLRGWITERSPDMEVVRVHGNALTNVGIQRLEDLLIGAGGQAYDPTHSRMGVGDGTTGAATSDTDLAAASGSTHRQFVVMNAGSFPGRSSQTVTWQSDFTSGLANFHWQEWCIDVGTTNGTTVTSPMLNRKVEDLGTKATGTWTLSGAVTIV